MKSWTAKLWSTFFTALVVDSTASYGWPWLAAFIGLIGFGFIWSSKS